jgi:phosphoglycolate phosphatase (TIGR01487 family)
VKRFWGDDEGLTFSLFHGDKFAPGQSLIATDLDGTIKMKEAPVNAEVITEMKRIRSMGVKLILVTGRCAKEQQEVIDGELFDAVVLENGAIVQLNEPRKRIVFSPPGWLEVKRRLIEKFGVGCEEIIVSLPREFGPMLEQFSFGLDVRILYNRDRVMVLPPSVDKRFGLSIAIQESNSQGRRVVCIGDGENDVDMFSVADLKLAVANAVPILKEKSDYVSKEEDGAGWVELVKQLFPEF